jgi:hypothetical protein
MIRTFSDEFESEGVEVVREKVAKRAYKDDEKHAQAVKWLNRQDPARKTSRMVRKQLVLARRTARETRIAVLLSAFTLVALILVLVKLWHG